MMEKKALEFSTTKSNVQNLGIFELSNSDELKSFVKAIFVNKGLCVAYLDHVVLVGKYDGEDFHFYQNEKLEPKFIQKMRLFDRNQELYLWKKNDNCFTGRLRIDGTGEETDMVEARQVLWGTKSKPCGDFTEISEDRGTKIILPFKDIEIGSEKDPKDRICILTRNYVSYKSNSSYEQAGYNDCRFVAFVDKNGNSIGDD